MSITIESALSINEQGTRDNNEDSLYPPLGEAKTNETLFIVCDGVGGVEHGELASKLTITAFADYFKQINPVVVSDEAYIEGATEHVQQQFDAYLVDHPEAKGMATTLTLLHLHENGATVAHIGDSRVYHIREGKIIWYTEDHSVVNEYIKHKIITPEEAESHPDRNKITRAIQGSDVKKAKADVKLIPIDELQAGDYFLLCSDGILEALTDPELESILGDDRSDEEKIEEIRLRCLEKSSDNYTAYLVKLSSSEADLLISESSAEQVLEESIQMHLTEEVITGSESDAPNDSETASINGVVGTAPVAEERSIEQKEVDQYIRKSKSGNRVIVAVFVVLALLALAYYAFK